MKLLIILVSFILIFVLFTLGLIANQVRLLNKLSDNAKLQKKARFKKGKSDFIPNEHYIKTQVKSELEKNGINFKL